MKLRYSIFVICLTARLLYAPSSQDGEIAAAAGTDKTSNPSNPSQIQAKDATLNTVKALTRNSRTSAGVEMKKSSSMDDPKQASPEVCEWFKRPAIYSDYGYNSLRDRRQGGLASDAHQFTVGGDFETIAGITVGAMYTFAYDHASSRSNTTQFHKQSDTHLYSAYAGKNFMDWINVGGSFTYSKTAADFTEFTGGFPSLDRYVDSYAVAGFIGVSHTWKAWQFASTPTFIYQNDDYSFPDSGRTPGALKPFNLDTTTFTWLNTVDYSVTEKFQIGGIFNWTDIMDQSHDPSPFLTGNDWSWVTLGARLTYYPIENLQTSLSYETDLLNHYYEDHRIRFGMTYSF